MPIIPHLEKSDFGFNFDDPRVFYQSEWQTCEEVCIIYLLYRMVFVSVSLAFWTFWAMWIMHVPWFVLAVLPAYLTNWSLLLGLVTAIFSFALVSYEYVTQHDDKPKDPINNKVYKYFWLCYNITTDLWFSVAFVYFMHDVTVNKDGYFLGRLTHGIFPLMYFLDGFFVKVPVKIQHVWTSLVVGTSYMMFNVIYELCGGRGVTGAPKIYPLINWKDKPLYTFGLAVLSNTILVGGRLFNYGLFRFRLFLVRSCRGEE